ncbi:MAG TPA: 50S ribosomal protein L11 methyltransferase, partial [Nitrospinota bacterium]|nr:50S ribosomal protein L11 methyltransferase [Nitrospinota bacterium]
MTNMIEYHKMMLSDRYRTNTFKRAIFETVKPGDVVLDLGAGTGILSFFACMAGAKRVYAVEVDSVIEIAKELARENNLKDKITFINNVSTDISLSEKVDIIISEILGSFGLEEDIIDYMADARERFLKKSGVLI